MKHLCASSTLFGVLLLLMFPVFVQAGSIKFTFTKIVDSLEAEPGVPGATFNIPAQGAPGNSGTNLSFVAIPGGTNNYQLWTSDTVGGHLRKLVDTNTKIPNGKGTFLFGYQNRLYGTTVVFLGIDNVTGSSGYYAVPVTGGTIKELVNQSTEKPDGTSKFGATAFSPYNFNLDSGSLVFVVLASGFAVPVSGTPLTEPDNPTKFFICETGYIFGGMGGYDYTDVSGTTMALMAGNVFGQAAIYYAPLSGLAGVKARCASPYLMVTNATRVASINTPVPADPHRRKFYAYNFASPAIDGKNIVFGGGATPLKSAIDLAGLYGYNTGTHTTVKLVDSNTPVPGGHGNFQIYGTGGISNGWTVSGGNVVFQGIDALGKEGLYLVSAGGETITKLLAIGDKLPDGRVVAGNGGRFFQPPIQPDSLYGRSLGIYLAFSGKFGVETAIYFITW
ncbi:MAG: hypothetical protein JOZ29_10265 [Deltaproteobacteria bacterium]|nr:hypothetical protein [Deltaproteobacteria bacterium]